ncbi:hypothetical protein SUGI_0897480 [Cryptomeria japonica]|nr:hypothetical protein SUGI_0897480 [Cryptomeria japonica]
MNGGIGKGATRESIAFATRMAENKNRPPGFLQLAGGMTSYTIEALKRIGLFQTTSILDCTMESANITMPFEAGKKIYTDALIPGVAYGGYAWKVVGRVLHKINFKLQANACEVMRQMYCLISLCMTWRMPTTIKTTKADIASPFPYAWYVEGGVEVFRFNPSVCVVR